MVRTQTLRRFLSYLKPHWPRALEASVCMGLSVLLELPRPLILMFLIDEVLIGQNRSMLTILCLALFLCVAFDGIIRFLQTYLLESFKWRIVFDIELDLFRHLESLPLNFFSNRETGYLVSRVTSDAYTVQGLLGDTIVGFVRDSLTFVVGPMILLVLHWKLTLLSIGILPLLGGVLVSFSKRLRGMSREVGESYAHASSDIQEIFSGIFMVKSFVKEKGVARRVVHSLSDFVRAIIRRTVVGASSGIAIGLIVGTAAVLVVWYGGSEIMSGHLTIGQFVAFNSLVAYLFGPTRRLVNLNLSVQTSLAALDRIFEIMDVQAERPRGTEDQYVKLTDIRGEVRFDGVTFSYDGRRPVLRQVSLSVNPGEFVGIVGRSGTGKTTLVNLIPRFYELEEGSISLDGIDVRKIDLKTLRQNIGIVPQETFLFSSSIKDNIRFARAGATDDEIVSAAKLANAHDFISRLPEGYDTKVGERGIRLSSGEKQRISVARVILKNARVLILDEATSNLDSESERLIREALWPLIRKRTTLVIAHRLSTILNADRILVLDDGRVVGAGKHCELYTDCEIYRRLYDEQFGSQQVMQACGKQKNGRLMRELTTARDGGNPGHC